MALAHAAGPQEYDVLGPFDKAQSGQFLDLGTWRTAGKGEVIILDGLDRGQRGNLHQGSPLAFDPGVVLDAQKAFQEVTMAGVLAGTLLGDGRPLAADTLQLQDVAELFDPVVLDVHARTSSSSL
ncbi:hypothetical protein AD428_15810 [Achromobacter sp. DMS1]|nr:hypothetical protein AD428_15810 [Achromobacter sp. DMS1]